VDGMDGMDGMDEMDEMDEGGAGWERASTEPCGPGACGEISGGTPLPL